MKVPLKSVLIGVDGSGFKNVLIGAFVVDFLTLFMVYLRGKREATKRQFRLWRESKATVSKTLKLFESNWFLAIVFDVLLGKPGLPKASKELR